LPIIVSRDKIFFVGDLFKKRSFKIRTGLRRDQRVNSMDFLKTIRTEQDRLENSSPIIQSRIIEKFNIKFAGHNIEIPGLCRFFFPGIFFRKKDPIFSKSGGP